MRRLLPALLPWMLLPSCATPPPEGSPAPTTAEVRDPWSGFPIGSWAILREVRTEGDGKPAVRRERHQVVKEDDRGGVETGVRKEEGTGFEAEGSTRMHVHGGTPESLGLEKVAERREDLEIEGRKFSCRVREYRNPKGGARADVLTRPFPEIMRDRGERVPEGVSIRLALWETDGVTVPYRELLTPGLDIAMGPGVVRAEWRMERGGEVEESVCAVERLSDVVEIGGRKVSCVVERTEFLEEGEKGVQTVWRSDAVPGREARIVAEGTHRGEKARFEKTVEAFRIAPRIAGPRGKPAPVAHPLFRGCRTGDWVDAVGWTSGMGPKPRLSSDRTTLLASLEDGALLVERRAFAGSGIGKTTWEILEPPRFPEKEETPVEAREETLEIGGRRLPCRVLTFRKAETHGGGETVRRTVLWVCDRVSLPVREMEFGPLLGEHVVRAEEELEAKGPEANRTIRRRRVLDFDVPVFANGRRRAAVLEEQEDENPTFGKSGFSMRRRYLASADVPGGDLASWSWEPGDRNSFSSVSASAAWGRAGDAPPPEPDVRGLEAAEALGAPSPRSDGWYGVPVGSSIDFRVDMTAPGKPPASKEVRNVLMFSDAAGKSQILRMTEEKPGRFAPDMAMESKHPRSPLALGFSEGPPCEEVVEIEGRRLACRARTFTRTGPNGKDTLRTWTQGELRLPPTTLQDGGDEIYIPENALRVTLERAGPDGRERRVREEVKRLREELDVGGRRIGCVVVELETPGAGAVSRQRLWISPEVPGRVVRLEMVREGAAEPAMRVALRGIRIPSPAAPAPPGDPGLPFGRNAPGSGVVRSVGIGPAGGPAERERVEEIVEGRLEDGSVVIRQRTLTGDEAGARSRLLVPSGRGCESIGMEVAQRKEEALELDGRTLKAVAVTWKRPGLRVTIWEADGVALPVRDAAIDGWSIRLGPRVVKARIESTRTPPGMFLTRQVSKWREEVAVGDRRFPCLVEEVRYTIPGRETVKDARVFTSADWPGWELKSVHTVRLPGRGPAMIVSQVESFVPPPPPAPAGSAAPSR